MRRLVMTIAVSIAAFGGVGAAELKSIEQVLIEEQSPAMVSYALKRCSAAYMTLSGLMTIEGGDAKLAVQASDMSTLFFSMTSKHSDQNAWAFDAKAVTAAIGDMVELYAEEAQRNYAATGNRIDGVFKEDVAMCREIYGTWQ